MAARDDPAAPLVRVRPEEVKRAGSQAVYERSRPKAVNVTMKG